MPDEIKDEGGESDGLDNLVEQGTDLPDETEEGAEEGAEGEEEEEGGPSEEVSALSSRFDALESRVAEKDAEITFLRGELAKKNAPAAAVKDADAIDMDELTARLTDKDPKVAAKAVVEMAEKIAERKVKAMRDETSGVVAGAEAVRTAKEQDRSNVLADFADYQDEEGNWMPDFERTLTALYKDFQKENGGRYVRGGLYMAAATAKTLVDKARARVQGTKNGVTKVRPQRESANRVESGAEDYSKAKTINDLSYLSDREKAAARAVAKKMGIKEADWVAMSIEQQQEKEAS